MERIALQATRSQPVEGEALEGRQEAARRALDEVLDRLVKEARVHLDARKRDDARLVKDLKAVTRWSGTRRLGACRPPQPRRHSRPGRPPPGDNPLEVRRAIGGLVELQAREAVPELIEIAGGRTPGSCASWSTRWGPSAGTRPRPTCTRCRRGTISPPVRDAARQALEEMNRHGSRVAERPSRNASLAPGRHP